MSRTILITGATGKQGGALIGALRSASSVLPETDNFRILALTRKASNPRARLLSQDHNIEVVEGDLNSLESIRKVFESAQKSYGGVWGVFCVLAYPGLGANADGEERQGKVRVICLCLT